MKSAQVQLGAGDGATGWLNLADGALEVSSLLTLGQVLNSTGVVAIAGGRLVATNDLTRVGNVGVGQFTMDGGSAEFAFLSLGETPGSQGSVTLNGGRMRVRPRTAEDFLRVGNFGDGQLTIRGGNHVIGSELHLAEDIGATGLLSIEGGTLTATNGRASIGRYGFGKMTVTQGWVQFTNSSIGRHDGAVGVLEILTNGTLIQVDDMSIGRFSNSVGRVLVDGGSLGLTNETVFVGREGTGELVLSNGTVSARTMWLEFRLTERTCLSAHTNLRRDGPAFLERAGGNQRDFHWRGGIVGRQVGD